MKIKCPECKNEFNIRRPDDITDHYFYNHLKVSMKDEFAKLIFKIHEKIESLNSIAEQEFGSGYPSPSTETQIELLESLLEDKNENH